MSPSTFQPATNPRLRLTPAARRPAFSLLEVMVAIGIIALLAAIVVPAATSLIDNQRGTGTQANMQIIENAIDAYRRCTKGTPPNWFSIRDLTPPHTGGERWDRATQDSNNNKRWDSGEPFDYDDGDGLFCPTNIRLGIPGVSGAANFNPIVRLRGGAYAADDYSTPQYKATDDYKPIETMYLWMTQLCPESRQILSALPSKVVTNKDSCGGVECPDYLVFDTNADGQNSQPYNTPGRDRTVDMFEIRDNWGKPLDYNKSGLGDPDVTDSRARQLGGWELRSAGPDGVMGNGDDVSLRGQ